MAVFWRYLLKGIMRYIHTRIMSIVYCVVYNESRIRRLEYDSILAYLLRGIMRYIHTHIIVMHTASCTVSHE